MNLKYSILYFSNNFITECCGCSTYCNFFCIAFGKDQFNSCTYFYSMKTANRPLFNIGIIDGFLGNCCVMGRCSIAKGRVRFRYVMWLAGG